MKFDNIGVFLGLISYPFYKDGKDIYDNIFKPFFAEHKKQIAKYDPDVQNEDKKDPYPDLYSPAGYRMFGHNGLAIFCKNPKKKLRLTIMGLLIL